MNDEKRTRSTTTDGRPPTDPAGPAPTRELRPGGQHAAYWVLSEEERAKGFVRPVRRSYVHDACGAVTIMAQAIAETYAREPDYYGATFCVRCGGHFPVAEFVWDDGSGERVGS